MMVQQMVVGHTVLKHPGIIVQYQDPHQTIAIFSNLLEFLIMQMLLRLFVLRIKVIQIVQIL